MDWVDLAQDRDRWQERVGVVVNYQGSIQCREFLD